MIILKITIKQSIYEMRGIFLSFIFSVSHGQVDQPDRWPKITSNQYQYSATKSFFFDDKGHGESQFIQFYSQYDEFTQNNWQVMSVRKDGIYTTAYWDRINKKAHFAYDKYSCDSVLLPSPPVDKNEPLEWINPKTGSYYNFFPDIVAIENEEMTTDPQIVSDLNGIVVRGRPAWKWTAKMHIQGLPEIHGQFNPIWTEFLLKSSASQKDTNCRLGIHQSTIMGN